MYISTADSTFIKVNDKSLSDSQAREFRLLIVQQANSHAARTRFLYSDGESLQMLAEPSKSFKQMVGSVELSRGNGGYLTNRNTVDALLRAGLAEEREEDNGNLVNRGVYLSDKMLNLIGDETIEMIEAGNKEDAEWEILAEEQRDIAVSVLQGKYAAAAPALQGIPSQTDGQDLAEVFEEYADGSSWIPSGTMVPVESLLQIAQRIQELEAAAK